MLKIKITFEIDGKSKSYEGTMNQNLVNDCVKIHGKNQAAVEIADIILTDSKNQLDILVKRLVKKVKI